jgi:hypothetical protein
VQLRQLLDRYNIRTPTVTIEYKDLTVGCRRRRCCQAARLAGWQWEPRGREEAECRAGDCWSAGQGERAGAGWLLRPNTTAGRAGADGRHCRLGRHPHRGQRAAARRAPPAGPQAAHRGAGGAGRHVGRAAAGPLDPSLGPARLGQKHLPQGGRLPWEADGLVDKRCMQPSSFPIASRSSLRLAARLAVSAPACCAFLHTAIDDRIIRTEQLRRCA